MIPIQQLTGRTGNQMFQFAYLYAQVKRGEIDDVYVQDPKYFEDWAYEIKEIYRQGVNGKVDQVAIHLRRGDYVNNPFYVDLAKTDYYDQAIDLFPDDTFLVFSDDIPFAKKYFKGRKFDFYQGKDEIDDLNVMAACSGHIIANSSFSWWGAYISPYTQKVVAPSVDRWYTDKQERTKCPSKWIRI